MNTSMTNLVVFELRTPLGVRKIYYRDVIADKGVLEQIFVNKDYDLGQLARANQLHRYYQSILDSGRRPLIVDCGANIGASAVWFASTYPEAVIAAIEPEQGNFDLLLRNTHGLRVESRQAAIGSKPGSVHVHDPGNGEWGYQTLAEGAGPCVDQIAMRDLVAGYMDKSCTPFIVKIDIEGGESELFSQSTEWIDLFPLLIIELHDWMLPGTGNSSNFLKSIANRGRDFVSRGENIFSIRNS